MLAVTAPDAGFHVLQAEDHTMLTKQGKRHPPTQWCALFQLWGCKVSAGEDVGDSVGDAVVLDPGSEAEEAVLVAAAAVAVVAFLRDMQLQPGGSQRAG